MQRERIDAYRDFGDQAERSFAADEQPGEVQLVIAQDIVEPISAAIYWASRSTIFDCSRVALDETGDRIHQSFYAICIFSILRGTVARVGD